MTKGFFKSALFLGSFSLLLFVAGGVKAAVPSITSLNPPSTAAGGSSFSLIVNGASFSQGVSTVLFNNVQMLTTYNSSTRLIAQIPAVSIQNPGLFPVVVLNSGPGGGLSNQLNFSVENNQGELMIIKKTTAQDGTFQFNVSPTVTVMNITTTNGLGSDKRAFVADDNYIISEVVPNNWNLTGAGCKLASGLTTGVFDTNSVVGVEIIAGQRTTCTFSNSPVTTNNATIIVKKNMSGSTTSFSFTGSPSGTISINGGTVSANVPPGIYTSTEAAKTGWTLSSINCDDSNSSGNIATRTATFNAAAGETITCTFTNSFGTGGNTSLQIKKECSPISDSGKFNLFIDTFVQSTNASCGTTTNAMPVSPGLHTINETEGVGTLLSNYTTTIKDAPGTNGCPTTLGGSINVVAGTANTCIITNTRNPTNTTASVTVIKKTGGSGSADFNFTNNFTPSKSIPTLKPNSTNFFTDKATISNINPGTYTIGETLPTSPAGWSLTKIECLDPVGDTRGTKSGNSITNLALVAGDTITCTFTNTYTPPPPTLTVNKILVPSSDSGRFNLQIDGSTVGTGANVGNGGTTGPITTTVGTHTIGETVVVGTSYPNYLVTYGGDCNSAGQITLAAGNNKVCTITNTRKPTLIINKVLSPANNSGKFNLFINNVQKATNVGNNGTTGAQYANVGNNTFSESAGTNTNLSDYSSSISGTGCGSGTTFGSITLAAGENKTCTFTNTYSVIPPTPTTGSIKVVKNALGGNTTFTFNSNFGVSSLTTTGSSNGGSAEQIVSNLTVGSNYNIDENVPSGWTLTGTPECVNDITGQTSPITAIAVAAGQQTTCTFNNALKGNIRIVKVATAGAPAATFNYTVAGPTSYSANISTSGGNGSYGPTPVTSGSTYSITETVPTGWKFDSVTCDKSFTPGGAGTNKAINVTVNPGQLTTCTFTNTYTASPTTTASVTVIKKTGGSGSADFNFTNNFTPSKSVPTLKPNSTNFFTDKATISNINPGTYTIGETLPTSPAGWSLTSAACVDANGNSKGTKNGNSVTGLTLAAGDDVTCTFTNTYTPTSTKGSLKVVKNTTGGDATFYFTSNFGAGQLATWQGTAWQTMTGLNAGSAYNISEDSQSDWTLSSVICLLENGNVTGSPATNGKINIMVEAGKTTTCTFTNTYTASPATTASVTVIKKTGGSGSADFNFTNNFTPSKSVPTLKPNSTNFFTDKATISNINPGTYTIGETLPTSPAGWSLTSAACVDTISNSSKGTKNGNSITGLTLAAGDDVTCTFTNTYTAVPMPPKLTVTKILIPFSDPGRFNLKIDGVTYASNVGHNGTTGPITVTVGNHTVGETVVAGTDPNNYTYAFGGACSSNGSITLKDGDNKTCTITNTRKSTPPPPPPPPPPPDPKPDPNPSPDPDPVPEDDDNVNFVLPPEGKGGGGSIIPPEN